MGVSLDFVLAVKGPLTSPPPSHPLKTNYINKLQVYRRNLIQILINLHLSILTNLCCWLVCLWIHLQLRQWPVNIIQKKNIISLLIDHYLKQLLIIVLHSQYFLLHMDIKKLIILLVNLYMKFSLQCFGNLEESWNTCMMYPWLLHLILCGD